MLPSSSQTFTTIIIGKRYPWNRLHLFARPTICPATKRRDSRFADLSH
jgi:hypothetical protein